MLPDPAVKPLLTVDELAALQLIPGKRRSALHDAVRAGDLPAVRIGGRIYIPVAELRRQWGLDPPQTAETTPIAIGAVSTAAFADPIAARQEDHP